MIHTFVVDHWLWFPKSDLPLRETWKVNHVDVVLAILHFISEKER